MSKNNKEKKWFMKGKIMKKCSKKEWKEKK